MAYKPKSKSGGKAKANKAINKAAGKRVGNRTQGKLMAKPGAKPAMSRSGAMGGKNPNAQVSKPKKSHTPGKGTK